MQNRFFEQVSEFNKKVIEFEQPKHVTRIPEEVKKLTLIQLREEVKELEESMTATDEVDALIDLVYFAYGALYKMGLTPYVFGTAASLVHEANMTKAAGKKAARGYTGSAMDAVKPKDFVPPEGLIAVLIDDKEFKSGE